MAWLDGETESEKSPVGTVCTAKVTVVEWLGTPVPDPLIVNVYEPVGVVDAVATVMVEVVLFAGIGLALYETVAPAGNPDVVKVTVSAKPPVRAIVTV
jgi:hypothetical protein